MSKRTLGVIAGVASSAFGAWWWNRQRGARRRSQMSAARDRGTVIYDNTPAASQSGIV